MSIPSRIAAFIMGFLFVCRGGILRADVASDVALLHPILDRSAGSEGALRNAEDMAAELAKRTGQTVWRQAFPMVLPMVETCTAVNGADPTEAIPISPLMPSGGQAAAIPAKLATADLFYAGQGSLEELRGHDVARKVIAMDVSSPPTAWQTVASLGAAGILFLGDGDTTNVELLNKATNLPVGIARFYCDDPVAVGRIKSGAIRSLVLDVRIRWEEKNLENVLCLIPGRATKVGGNPQWTNQLVILQARLDGSSQVMGRAPGATQAVNAALALDLAEKIAAAPEHCSVLIALTAGDEWDFRGTRALLDLLRNDVKDPARTVLILNAQIAGVENRLHTASAIREGLGRVADGNLASARLEPARTALEDELLRSAARIETELEHARLDSASPLIQSLEEQKQELLSATNVLHTTAAINGTQESQLKSAAANVIPVWQTEAERLTRLREDLMPWPRTRAALDRRVPTLFLSLNITSGSDHYGFFSRSFYASQFDATGPMSAFSQSLRRYQAPNDAVFQADSLENRFSLETFFPTPQGFSSDAALDRALPAGAFATTQDPAPALDTPNDTPERINWTHIGVQQKNLETMLLGGGSGPGLLTDPLFYGRADLPTYAANQSVTLFERTLGETLPRLRAASTLIGTEALSNGKPLGPALAGTQRMDWYLTFADGTAEFQSALRAPSLRLIMQAFTFDANGLPIRTLAGNQADKGLAADFFPDADRPVRAMLFDCRRLDAYNLFDPRYLDAPENIDILDARRLDNAEFSGTYVADGFAALFFPPDIRWQLLVSKGNVNNRMVLINADHDHPTGQGYDTTDLALLGPLPLRNALDLQSLNSRRQLDLEKFGVSNDVIKELQAASPPLRKAALAAQKSFDTPALFANANALWSLQSQVYQSLIDTSNGIIKAVIFLLLALIPFSYFLERLLIGSTNVYRQIGGFIVIFLLMTAALLFHPAFRISSAPIMILLAFFILILSCTVVYILWGKFEEEIARLQGAGAAAHSISLRRGAVFGAAVRLGLSNMRRRGTRTGLTLATLILLTFTLLCFTSVRDTVELTARILPTTDVPPPGILIRQRAYRTLPPESLDLVRGWTQDSGLKSQDFVSPRYWYSSEKAEQPWSLPVVAYSDTAARSPEFFASALLGLSPSEGMFHQSTLIPQEGTCWLPEKSRELLHANVGDSVRIMGHSLTIAGFFSAHALSELRQLNGDSIAPIDPQSTIHSANNASDTATPVATVETSYRFISPDNLVILPADLVRDLGGRLTSIMMRPADASPAAIDGLAVSLAKRSAFTLYSSDGKQVRSLNAAAASSPQDFGDVLIPMLIAGVIVLNTMLGAVAERTREIHVYTSVGLAPAHIGMLFLAEAAAIGTLGVVAGYIFGQGVATILSYTHLLPGIALNYSSLSAIVTMGIVLGIVMLSALWPARAASRVAAPSLQSDWKLPKPEGDLLAVDLPFTVNESAAKGVSAFIEEFLVTTSQSGTGHFTADDLIPFLEKTTQGPVRGLTARIWLAPYDLGVIQTIRLAIHPTDQHHVFEVHIDLMREAGNPASWHRLNRPFLIDLRKQFLLWRNLSHEQTDVYLARSNAMFNAK